MTQSPQKLMYPFHSISRENEAPQRRFVTDAHFSTRPRHGQPFVVEPHPAPMDRQIDLRGTRASTGERGSLGVHETARQLMSSVLGTRIARSSFSRRVDACVRDTWHVRMMSRGVIGMSEVEGCGVGEDKDARRVV